MSVSWISWMKIWPAEIKLYVNLLYASSLYLTKMKENKGSEEVMVCDGDRLSVVSIAYSVVLLKNVNKVHFWARRGKCAISYIYRDSCLNEQQQQQQQRFGYTECESNPWVTPLQLMRMVFNYILKPQRKITSICCLSRAVNDVGGSRFLKTLLICRLNCFVFFLTNKQSKSQKQTHLGHPNCQTVFGSSTKHGRLHTVWIRQF